jgi:hypothetical protein
MAIRKSSALTHTEQTNAVLAVQLDCYREKLAVIDDHLHRCLLLPPWWRPRLLLAFLWKEHSIYQRAVKELEQLKVCGHDDAQ